MEEYRGMQGKCRGMQGECRGMPKGGLSLNTLYYSKRAHGIIVNYSHDLISTVCGWLTKTASIGSG